MISKCAFLFLILVSCGTLLPGCGNSVPPPEAAPFDGKISFHDGKPVPYGTMEFQSKDDNRVLVTGEVTPEGTFALRTVRDGHRLSGAKPGTYSVIFTPPNGNKEKVAPYRFPKPVVITSGENILELVLPKR
jgi:hypothetical protein